MSKNMKMFGWICIGGCVVIMAVKIVTFGPAAVLGTLVLVGPLIKVAVEHYNS